MGWLNIKLGLFRSGVDKRQCQSRMWYFLGLLVVRSPRRSIKILLWFDESSMSHKFMRLFLQTKPEFGSEEKQLKCCTWSALKLLGFAATPSHQVSSLETLSMPVWPPLGKRYYTKIDFSFSFKWGLVSMRLSQFLLLNIPHSTITCSSKAAYLHFIYPSARLIGMLQNATTVQSFRFPERSESDFIVPLTFLVLCKTATHAQSVTRWNTALTQKLLKIFRNMWKAGMQPCFNKSIQSAFFAFNTAFRVWLIGLVKHDAVL